MKMSAFDYHMIDRYLDGDLSPEERNAFEDQMRDDEALRQEVALYKELNESLQVQLHPNEGEKSLRSTMEEMRGEFFAKAKTGAEPIRKVVPIGKSRRWLAVAASIVILLAAAIFFWGPWKKDLYEQYAYTKMPAVTERGVAADSLLKLATEDFNDDEFVAAIPRFESLLRLDPQNSFARYYYAIALLNADKTENARSEFNELYIGSSTFKYDAAFYMALSYLKVKAPETARQWLQRIPVGAANHNKAQELLKKL